jgi:predicted transcriptional regulator
MANKAKVTLSIDAELDQKLSEIGKKRRIPKSRLVEEALRIWQRKLQEEELRVGYTAMAGEDARASEEFLPAVAEDLE